MQRKMLLLVVPETPAFDYLKLCLDPDYLVYLLRPDFLRAQELCSVPADIVAADVAAIPPDLRRQLLNCWLDDMMIPLIDLSKVRDPKCKTPDSRAIVPKPPFCTASLPTLVGEIIHEELQTAAESERRQRPTVSELMSVLGYSVSDPGYSYAFEALMIMTSGGCKDPKSFSRRVVIPVAEKHSVSVQCARKNLKCAALCAWERCDKRLRALLLPGFSEAEGKAPSSKQLLFAASAQLYSGCGKRRRRFLFEIKNDLSPLGAAAPAAL